MNRNATTASACILGRLLFDWRTAHELALQRSGNAFLTRQETLESQGDALELLMICSRDWQGIQRLHRWPTLAAWRLNWWGKVLLWLHGPKHTARLCATLRTWMDAVRPADPGPAIEELLGVLRTTKRSDEEILNRPHSVNLLEYHAIKGLEIVLENPAQHLSKYANQ